MAAGITGYHKEDPYTTHATLGQSTLWGMAQAVEIQKLEPWAKIMEKNSLGASRGGRRVATITATASLDRLQAQSIWEMSVKTVLDAGEKH